MTVIQPFIDRLDDIERNLYNVAKEIIKEDAEFIIGMLKHGQLEQGLNSYGKIVGRYSVHTQGYANADNISTPKRFGDPYNFFWSGQTVENLKVSKITKKSFEITTVKFKQNLLEEIYGELFDLTEEHNEYYNNEMLLPKLYEKIIDNMLKGLI